MLRIRFQRDDLTRVRFLISPMGETILSVAALQRQGALLPFAAWREVQRPKLAAAPSRVLLGLVPTSWQPSVALAPIVGERPWFDEELDAVLEFSPRPLRSYLATLGSPALTARWMPMLPDDAGGERRLLARLLTDYHRRCLADHWPAVRTLLEADLAYRNRLLVGQGVAQMLSALHPAIRWCDPFLEVDTPGPSRQIELAGCGLVLVPSVFAWPDPAFLLDGDGQPVLLYPARDLLSMWTAPGFDDDILAALLGATRAAVLVATACGDSTSHLADRLDVSVASVSQHLTTLRTAGLVRSTRRARAVHHDLTPLGVQLLLASGRFNEA
jgi:hypothetical protein